MWHVNILFISHHHLEVSDYRWYCTFIDQDSNYLIPDMLHLQCNAQVGYILCILLEEVGCNSTCGVTVKNRAKKAISYIPHGMMCLGISLSLRPHEITIQIVPSEMSLSYHDINIWSLRLHYRCSNMSCRENDIAFYKTNLQNDHASKPVWKLIQKF